MSMSGREGQGGEGGGGRENLKLAPYMEPNLGLDHYPEIMT